MTDDRVQETHHESRIYRAWPHGPSHGAPPARRRPRGRRLQSHGRQTKAADRRRRQSGRPRSKRRRISATRFSPWSSDDAAALEVVGQAGGLMESLPQGGIHICAGTHSVDAIQKLAAIHGEAGQILIATPMLGRPEVVTAGQAGIVVGGPPEAVARLRPLFTAIAPTRDRCRRRAGRRRGHQDRQ